MMLVAACTAAVAGADTAPTVTFTMLVAAWTAAVAGAETAPTVAFTMPVAAWTTAPTPAVRLGDSTAVVRDVRFIIGTDEVLAGAFPVPRKYCQRFSSGAVGEFVVPGVATGVGDVSVC